MFCGDRMSAIVEMEINSKKWGHREFSKNQKSLHRTICWAQNMISGEFGDIQWTFLAFYHINVKNGYFVWNYDSFTFASTTSQPLAQF